MKLSLNIFGRQFSLGTEKAVSPAVADFLRGNDLDSDNGGAKMTSPYSQSSWVYIAISRLAEKISSIPFRISQMDSQAAKRVRALRNSSHCSHKSYVRKALGETIIESGDVVDLFNCPHPTMNRQLFWEMVVTWNCLRGEFFILPLDQFDQPVDLAMSAPRVARLLTLPTDMFWHVVTGYELNGWRYTGSPLISPLPSEMLLPSEVIHSRTPNPFLYWRGMSPLFLALGPAAADYAASQYNKGYWLNNADTGLIVTTEQTLTPEQREAICAALRERKRKAGTPDRPLFLGAGAKVEKPTLSGMESQMIENRKMNRQEILAIFKMTDSVIGLTDSKSSALSGGGNAINQEEVKFVESTLAPLCEHLEAAVDPIVKTFGPGLMGWFDIDGLPIMQEARRARLDAGVKAFGIGASFNDINRVYDLGFPEYKGWGNKNFLPFSLQEASAVGSEELPGEDAPEEKEKGNPFARMSKLLVAASRQSAAIEKTNLAALWQKHVNQRRPSVKLMESRTRRVLKEFQGTALSTLAKFDLSAKSAESADIRLRSLVDLIFNAKQFGEKLFKELSGPIRSALQHSGDSALKELGINDPWKMPPAKAVEYLGQRTQPIMDCGKTVRNQLNTALQTSLTEGESLDEIAERVKTVFTDLGDSDARRIALTETNGAYNDARNAAFESAGIQFKAWLTSRGPNVRPAHQQAEMDYNIDTPIPLNEPFRVGGEEMMFPGDSSMGASAGNIINCQCIQLAASKESEDTEVTTFKVLGVGVLKFSKSMPSVSVHDCPCHENL